jgi:probable HAF family extracellular repeat protein
VAINAKGDVTGAAAIASGFANHAFLYHEGRMLDLGTLGGDASAGNAINDSGDIAGDSDVGPFVSHAFLYTKGRMLDLGTLGGDVSGAEGINAAGDIVGVAETQDLQLHAFLYRNGMMIDLNKLIRYHSAQEPVTLTDARGVSDSGLIIANGINSQGAAHAYVLSPLD